MHITNHLRVLFGRGCFDYVHCTALLFADWHTASDLRRIQSLYLSFDGEHVKERLSQQQQNHTHTNV